MTAINTMSQSEYLGIISAIFFILIGLLGWIGARIFIKLDGLAAQLTASDKERNREMTEMRADMHKAISEGDNELHSRVTELDRRVTRVETRCATKHEYTEV